MRDVEGTRPVTRSVFYNNAGSLGALQALEDLPSLASVRSAIDFNVTAHIWITATWVKLASGMHRRRHEDEAKAASDDAEPTSCNNGSGALPDAGAPERSGPLPSSSSGAGGSAAASAVQGDLSTPPCTVVNVSSGAAVGAMPTFGLYCSGKAARDMLTRCLALECAAKVRTHMQRPCLCVATVQAAVHVSSFTSRVTHWHGVVLALLSGGD